jgi:hypothetical protein
VTRFLDELAAWLRHRLGVQNQLRLGVVMVLASIPLIVWGFWTEEPFLVYEMSAVALLFGGVGVVVTAETLNEVAEDVEQLVTGETCRTCGQRIPPARQRPVNH